MKQLCEPCDEQMKLTVNDSPEEGSLSMAFGCPKWNPADEVKAVAMPGVFLGAQDGGGFFFGQLREMCAGRATVDVFIKHLLAGFSCNSRGHLFEHQRT